MVITCYAALGAVVLSLLIFAPLVILGAALVRFLKLSSDLPHELHFAPPAPAIHGPLPPADCARIAAVQARLSLIHGRARQCLEISASLAEYRGLALADADRELLRSASERAERAAKEADAGRKLEIEQADAETTRCLAEATAAWEATQTAREAVPPGGSSTTLVVVLATILVLVGVVVIIMHAHLTRS